MGVVVVNEERCVAEWGEGSKAYPISLIEHYGRLRHTRSQQSKEDPLMVLVQLVCVGQEACLLCAKTHPRGDHAEEEEEEEEEGGGGVQIWFY